MDWICVPISTWQRWSKQISLKSKKGWKAGYMQRVATLFIYPPAISAENEIYHLFKLEFIVSSKFNFLYNFIFLKMCQYINIFCFTDIAQLRHNSATICSVRVLTIRTVIIRYCPQTIEANAVTSFTLR